LKCLDEYTNPKFGRYYVLFTSTQWEIHLSVHLFSSHASRHVYVFSIVAYGPISHPLCLLALIAVGRIEAVPSDCLVQFAFFNSSTLGLVLVYGHLAP